jgi:hypothetical protein
VKSSSRLLIGFGIGIAVLVIITVALVLTLGQRNAPSLPADSPEGVVQRFLLAVQSKDYSAAYNYLAPPQTPADKNFPPRSFESFTMSAQNASNHTWKATLSQTVITGDNASVEVAIEVFASGGPFGNVIHTNNITFFLKNAGNAWLIVSPTDLYWLY